MTVVVQRTAGGARLVDRGPLAEAARGMEAGRWRSKPRLVSQFFSDGNQLLQFSVHFTLCAMIPHFWQFAIFFRLISLFHETHTVFLTLRYRQDGTSFFADFILFLKFFACSFLLSLLIRLLLLRLSCVTLSSSTAISDTRFVHEFVSLLPPGLLLVLRRPWVHLHGCCRLSLVLVLEN